MTISSTARKAGPFNGNDSTTTFPFAFKVFSTADVLVVHTDAGGTESTLVLGTDYTVSLNADQDVSPGGNVVKTTALATGTKLTITSDVENLQPVDLTNQGGFYPKVIGTALDRLTIMVQQLAEQVSRSVKVGISSTTTPDELVAELSGFVSDAAGYASDAAASSGLATTAAANAEAAELGAEVAAASVGFTLTSTSTFQNKSLMSSDGNTVEATSGPGNSQLSDRNKVFNGGFVVNQRAYVSGAAVGAGLYGHDRWKMAASGDTYTFSTTNNKTTVTIPAGKVLRQVVEGLNLQTGTYVLSWEGTAQGKIGAGSYGASGVTGAITGGTDTTIEFGPGTVANVQLEIGNKATPFEHRSYGKELALCQRYYESGNGAIGGYSGGAGISAYYQLPFKVSKRVIPTLTYAIGSNVNCSVADVRNAAVDSLRWFCQTTAAGGFIWDGSWTANAEL